MNAITCKGLIKKYGDFVAVKGIDFDVYPGKLFAFLGPNGAGKSTTIKMLATLLQKDAGEVEVFDLVLDQDNDAIRQKIGIVFQENVCDDLLTVKENLLYRGVLYFKKDKAGLQERLKALTEFLDLESLLPKRFGQLSGGQKRRVEIARALISNPDILILDEPTTGLDPETRVHVWKTIDYLRKTFNMTIFLTTHYMEEAANADWVVVIDEGEIKAQGTPQTLKDHYSFDTFKCVAKEKKQLKAQLDAENVTYDVVADAFVIRLETTLEALTYLEKYRHLIESFEVIKGNMDDVFINIIRGVSA